MPDVQNINELSSTEIQKIRTHIEDCARQAIINNDSLADTDIPNLGALSRSFDKINFGNSDDQIHLPDHIQQHLVQLKKLFDELQPKNLIEEIVNAYFSNDIIDPEKLLPVIHVQALERWMTVLKAILSMFLFSEKSVNGKAVPELNSWAQILFQPESVIFKNLCEQFGEMNVYDRLLSGLTSSLIQSYLLELSDNNQPLESVVNNVIGVPLLNEIQKKPVCEQANRFARRLREELINLDTMKKSLEAEAENAKNDALLAVKKDKKFIAVDIQEKKIKHIANLFTTIKNSIICLNNSLIMRNADELSKQFHNVQSALNTAMTNTKIHTNFAKRTIQKSISSLTVGFDSKENIAPNVLNRNLIARHVDNFLGAGTAKELYKMEKRIFSGEFSERRFAPLNFRVQGINHEPQESHISLVFAQTRTHKPAKETPKHMTIR